MYVSCPSCGAGALNRKVGYRRIKGIKRIQIRMMTRKEKPPKSSKNIQLKRMSPKKTYKQRGNVTVNSLIAWPTFPPSPSLSLI